MRKFFAVLLAGMMIVPFSVFASADYDPDYDYDVNQKITVAALDVPAASGSVIVYPNDTDEERYLEGEDYAFRSAELFIFDKDGKLIEVGAQLVERSKGGSPQFGIKIPAKGYAVASIGNATLSSLRTHAMQSAMLYNATMSVIREAYGFFDRDAMTLTVKYDYPDSAPEDAVKFLFVGNSSTYFNGTPVKFQGLCQAAGIDVQVTYCTFGSAYLHEFADENHERGKALRTRLKVYDYDYVFLQDASGVDLLDMQNSVKTLLPIIEENGAKPVLYMRYGTGVDRQVHHHEYYTKTANKFGIMCSPSADAYKICLQTHPEIELMADDNGHHSKEGSYLIACTWLYTVFGKDPRGNAYDAQLKPEVAKILQDIAFEAASNYHPEQEATDETPTEKIDGKDYKLASYQKEYTVTGAVYEGKWTDADASGKPLGKLTDGEFAANGSDTTVGCWSGKEQKFVIDLGQEYDVKEFLTDLFGNESWGIGDPEQATVSVAVSADGKQFTQVDTLAVMNDKSDATWTGKNFKLVLENTVSARFVEFSFTLPSNFCWTSELAVYGNPKGQTDVSEEASGETSGEEKPEGKKDLAWLYYVLGGVVVVGIAAAAIIISKKKK